MIEFQAFQKIGRLSRSMVITEKIDGTNAQIIINEDREFGCASRTRIITPDDDNFGFAKWAYENKEELMKLGPGRHFGEWWGPGIQRRYGVAEKTFSLFSTSRWATNPDKPACVSVVPILYVGDFEISSIRETMDKLKTTGSIASPGFMLPEGVVVYHAGSRTLFKKTFEKDDAGKGNGDQ